MQHSNPFFNRNSIVHPRHFYNRTETVSKVLDLLYKGVCVTVTGPRRIGRSSFLRYLSEISTHLEYGFSPVFHRLFVYVDCTPCQEQARQNFYVTVINRLRSAMLKANLDVSMLPSGSVSVDSDSFVEVLSCVSDQYGQIVLLLDEFDYIYSNSQLDESFFSFLRSLNTQGIATFCNALANTTQTNPKVTRYTSTAAFNGIFIRFPLTLFAPNESRQLIEHQLANQLGFNKDLIGYIVEELAGNHPYLLQIAAYEAFEMAVISEGFLTVRRLEELYNRFYDQASYYWGSQFSQLTLIEQRALILLNIGIQPPAEVGASLQYAGLLVKHEDRWNFPSPTFQKFVQSQRVEGLIQIFLQTQHSRSDEGHLLVDQLENCAYLDRIRLVLSPLPQQLLHCLAERPNQIVTIQEIEMRLWPGDKFYDGSEERIKPHIRLLRDALANATSIQNHRGLGYALVTR